MHSPSINNITRIRFIRVPPLSDGLFSSVIDLDDVVVDRLGDLFEPVRRSLGNSHHIAFTDLLLDATFYARTPDVSVLTFAEARNRAAGDQYRRAGDNIHDLILIHVRLRPAGFYAPARLDGEGSPVNQRSAFVEPGRHGIRLYDRSWLIRRA